MTKSKKYFDKMTIKVIQDNLVKECVKIVTDRDANKLIDFNTGTLRKDIRNIKKIHVKKSTTESKDTKKITKTIELTFILEDPKKLIEMIKNL